MFPSGSKKEIVVNSSLKVMMSGEMVFYGEHSKQQVHKSTGYRVINSKAFKTGSNETDVSCIVRGIESQKNSSHCLRIEFLAPRQSLTRKINNDSLNDSNCAIDIQFVSLYIYVFCICTNLGYI